MNKYVSCTGKTANDCFECNKYYSSHSSHYDSYYDKRIIEITCSIGGHKIFEDDDTNCGKQLNN